MKNTLKKAFIISFIFNFISFSLFGFLIYNKGGISYLAEKAVQLPELVQRTWFNNSSKNTVSIPPASEKPLNLTTIKLNTPEMDKGRPLMQVLKERKSERAYSDQPLSLQDLSNLLWAADGITRTDGRRTAPSARNMQQFDIYIIMKNGIYVYAPISNELIPVVEGDYRKNAGLDAYVAAAPVNLIYVADLAKLKGTTDENTKILLANLDVGFIAENVALFCTSEGFASVPRLGIDKDTLSKILKLRPEQKIILATTVGYRK